ncbi:MAG: hypothetical protein NZM42_14075 [Gemmatales bacterium]|nr:hypothetical protein [Gemmatales bacterium]MDW8224302.1 hypothetical protein [Gemmatales bacterium]
MEIKLRLITTYFLSLAIVLCVTAVGKITTVLQNPKLIWETDSTLDLPKGVVLLGACVLEICVSIFLLFSKSARMKASLVLWLSTIFFAYRVARWLGNEDVPCSCTGALEVIVPGGPATADRAAIWVLGYMVAGSALLLGSHIWAIAAQQAQKQYGGA